MCTTRLGIGISNRLQSQDPHDSSHLRVRTSERFQRLNTQRTCTAYKLLNFERAAHMRINDAMYSLRPQISGRARFPRDLKLFVKIPHSFNQSAH
jgi:hypothetical protein